MLVMMVVLMVGWLWHSGGDGRGGHMRGQQQATPAEKTPLELLDETYARGQLSREEYLQRRADLLRP